MALSAITGPKGILRCCQTSQEYARVGARESKVSPEMVSPLR